MRVLHASEGPPEVHVFDSAADPGKYFEAIDVKNEEYVFFGDDGTIISPSVRDEGVVLTPTSEKRLETLRERLRLHGAPQDGDGPELAEFLRRSPAY